MSTKKTYDVRQYIRPRLTKDEESWIYLGHEYLELIAFLQDNYPDGYEILADFDKFLEKQVSDYEEEAGQD